MNYKDFDEFVQKHNSQSDEVIEDKLASSLSSLMIEMHWTEEQMLNTHIPVVFSLLKTFKKRNEEMEAQMKKSKGSGIRG